MSFFKRFRRPKAELLLTVDKRELTLGDELKGIVKVRSEEELDVEEIGVSLSCNETVKKIRKYQETIEVEDLDRLGNPKPRQEKVWKEEEYEDEETLYSDHSQLSGSMHVSVGFYKEFPFVIKSPSIGRETYRSVNQNVRWWLSAYLKVKGRPILANKVGSSSEILVSKPSASVKEVVREIVLIPCSYCSGLMPQTSIFCPNCGARRKS